MPCDNCGVVRLILNDSPHKKNIEIPSVINGQEIKQIGTRAFWGHFDRIIMADSITTVDGLAFFNSIVSEVIWSSNCQPIPKGCFAGSTIRKVKNIENVTHVGSQAFEDSNIRELCWPSSCDTIPEKCFQLCKLEKLYNVDNVQVVEANAFSMIPNLNHLDFSKNLMIHIDDCAFEGTKQDKICFPYYMASTLAS